jgi:NAD(P)-dependent dehydrogenase (short-subunit alcohol dehydrogenase family)
MALTDGGRYYSYPTSKAALNMLTRLFAGNLRPLGITVISMHPGWVQTDMGGSDASLPPEASVSGMLRVIDHLALEDTGKFCQWDGSQPPW